MLHVPDCSHDDKKEALDRKREQLQRKKKEAEYRNELVRSCTT